MDKQKQALEKIVARFADQACSSEDFDLLEQAMAALNQPAGEPEVLGLPFELFTLPTSGQMVLQPKFNPNEVDYLWNHPDGELILYTHPAPTQACKVPERPDHFYTDAMEYSVEDANEVAEYHGGEMNLNSKESIEVRCFKNLPLQTMEVAVDADGNITWQWLAAAPEVDNED